MPVRFIAFGAEEPRGAGDALHHFGSQQHVADLSRAEREATGRGGPGPGGCARLVCAGLPPPSGGGDLRADVRAAARRVDMPPEPANTTSDHWSYAKAGVPGIRLGRIPYAGYHSPRRHLPWSTAASSTASARRCGPGCRACEISREISVTQGRANGPRLVDHTSSRIPGARSPFTTRGTKRESMRVRHRFDRLHLIAPQHDLDEDPFHRLGLEVHVEDEVADECTTNGMNPCVSQPCTQWGCPPITRSAPASAKARAARRWLGSGTWVYWVPQWGITTTMSTCAQGGDRRLIRSSGAVQAGRSGAHVQPVGAAPGGGAAGVSPIESARESRSGCRRG